MGHNGLYEGLKVLSEWAYRIRVAKEDVEAERNIILEEGRGRQGSSKRMLDTYWEKIFTPQNGVNACQLGLLIL